MLREKMIPCQSREALVTVLSYQNGIVDGYLQHPRLQQKVKIQNLAQLLLVLNDLLDLENCPNSPLPFVSQEEPDREQIAVFRIQVLFREHYTWQGRLIWENENQEAVFHSAIEMVRLIDEILGE